MRSLATFVVAAAVAIVVQTALTHRLSVLPAAPDLTLVLATYLGLHYHSPAGAAGAFLLGYLLDVFSGAAPGLYCLTTTLVYGVVYLLSKRLWMENPVSNVAAVALGEGLKIFTVLVFLAIAARGGPRWLAVLRTLGLEAVLALLLTPLVFSALDSQLRAARQARAREAE